MMESSSHLIAILGAFFVTILWSSSWVLIKIGLQDINPIIFAGIRYAFAGLLLMSRVLISNTYRQEIKKLDRSWWLKLTVYGLFFYTMTQGAQFVGLFYLPAITVSFMLNLTSILVLILGIFLLSEYPSKKQILLIGLGFIGVILFFYPITISQSQIVGIIIVAIGVVSNAFSSIMGRSLNQVKQVSPMVITAISMVIGSIFLLGGALIVEGIPDLSLSIIVIIIWLAVINTALAFVIWNHTLQQLTAIESSIINSTMLPQITILAMVFFDERLILKELVGLILIFITGLLIPLMRRNHTTDLANID